MKFVEPGSAGGGFRMNDVIDTRENAELMHGF